MNKKVTRKPIKHFFLKKSMQISIIFKIIFIVFLTSLITTIILSYNYITKSKGGNFYYMSNDIMKDLELTNILGLVLPALIIAQLVTLIIVFFIGMSSSRKAAVPIYRLEKWANQIKNGNLMTNLGFRETEVMKDLTLQCNNLARKYSKIFFDIDQSIYRIKSELYDISLPVKTEIKRIEDILNTLKYKE
jgi:hypothetical protein